MDGHFLNFVNFVNFWTIFGQFSRSSKKKLLFLTKKKKKLFYDFLSSKICFLNEKFFSDNLGQFLDNFRTIFLFQLCYILWHKSGNKKPKGGPRGPGGFNGTPGIQGRPIVGDSVDLVEPGGVPVGLNYITMPYSEYCHLKSFCICKIELSIKNWGGRPGGPGGDPEREPRGSRGDLGT